MSRALPPRTDEQPYVELNAYVGLVGASVVVAPFFLLTSFLKSSPGCLHSPTPVPRVPSHSINSVSAPRIQYPASHVHLCLASGQAGRAGRGNPYYINSTVVFCLV
ncbi:hypothetical protein E2C01_051149 [Portunus trituberculatus]|uniref:Uncharacterized protein n=1 Tax=Portunus trituberculatus TaxID=210409 RepID=A0A5B7GL00_PORTR|nr:hypothetical protein [Portunus trituberculatus]